MQFVISDLFGFLLQGIKDQKLTVLTLCGSAFGTALACSFMEQSRTEANMQSVFKTAHRLWYPNVCRHVSQNQPLNPFPETDKWGPHSQTPFL
jgi:hypothetical protein